MNIKKVSEEVSQLSTQIRKSIEELLETSPTIGSVPPIVGINLTKCKKILEGNNDKLWNILARISKPETGSTDYNKLKEEKDKLAEDLRIEKTEHEKDKQKQDDQNLLHLLF